MGILNGRHVFTQKFITAIIIDESNRAIFVPIKNPIGDYFLATINNQTYAFKINHHIYTYRHTLAKSFQFTVYHTTHYEPITCLTDPIKKLFKDLGISKMNGKFAHFLKFLSFKEQSVKSDEKFEPHHLEDIIEVLTKKKDAEDNPSPELINLITFVKDLPFDQVVTPVQPISDFIEDTLKATDPKFTGSLATALTATDFEHKKTSNTAVNAKKPMLKLAVIGLLIAVGAVFLIIAYDEGYLTSIIPEGISLDGFSTPEPPTESEILIEKYPDPVDLKNAVDSGEIPILSLPDDIRKLLENIEPPVNISVP